MRGRWINIPGLVTAGLLLLIWEILVRSGTVAFDFFPAPSAIAVALFNLLLSGPIPSETVHTLGVVLVGWIVASLIGIAAGAVLGFSAGARRYALASVEVLRPMPAVALLPLAVLLFSFSMQTELTVVIYASVWPVLINTMGAIRDVGLRLREVGRTLGLSRWSIVWKLLLPAAVPSVLVGLRLGMGTAFVMAIIAEMLANPQGLGFGLVSQQQALQPDAVFAYVIYLGLLGVALNGALMAVSRVLLSGHFQRPVRA